MLNNSLKTFEHRYFYSIIDRDDPQSIPDFHAANIENFLIRDRGQLVMRKGLTARGSSPAATNLGAAVLYQAGQNPLMIRVLNGAADTSKFQQSTDGTTWSDISGGGSKKTGVRWVFAQANNALYGTNGQDTCVKITTSGISTVAAIPKGTSIEWWKNHMWTTGVSGAEDVLYFSSPNDPETWNTTTQKININLGDTSVNIGLRGMGGVSGRLIVGKERSVWYITGSSSSDFALNPLTYEHGICSPEAIFSVHNDVWGVDLEGNIRAIYRTTEDTPFSNLKSEDIQSTISGLNKISLNMASGVYFDNYAMFFLSNGVDSYNSITMVFDRLANDGKGGWIKFTNWNIARAVVFDTNQPKLFLFDARTGNGQTYEWTGTSDNGQAILSKFESKIYDFGVPERRKRFSYAYQFAPAQGNVNMRFYSSIDRFYYTLLKTFSLLGTGNKQLGVDWTLGTDKLGSGGFVQQRIYFTDGGGSGEGYTAQIKIEAESTTAQIKIKHFTAHFRPLGLR